MKSMADLRRKLISVSGRVERGTMDPKIAMQFHNGIGKIISSVKVEMEYRKLRKEKPNISFMEGKP